MLKPLKKFISSFIAVAFVIVVFFCLNAELNHTSTTNASCCTPASSHISSHQPDIGEHFRHWQQTFTATHPSSNDLIVFLSVLFVALAFGSHMLRLRNFELDTKLFFAKIYKERNAIAKLFNPILQALSRGILNPQLYNLSFVIR